MDVKKLEARNSSLDIIRIVAVFTVVSVHFFLNNGFYYENVQGAPMYIMCLMRTLFSVCVPLFMLLTGYLMCHKTLSKGYYKGIRKTLVVFVIATVACMVYKAIYMAGEFTLSELIFSTLDFSGANYSWYIEMYIGLFLIIPFLNLAYNGLKEQKQKQVLVLTFAALTVFPTLFNIYNFDAASWWANPVSNEEYQKLVPSFWMSVYPITYYFTGCYLREYGMKIKTRTLVITLVAALILFGSFNFYRSYGSTFKSGIYVYWYGFEPYVLSSLLFTLLSRIKTENMKKGGKYVLWKLSDLALGIYLLSFIADQIIYPNLNNNVEKMTDRLPYYFLVVPAVFLLSALMSLIANILADFFIKSWEKLVKFIHKQKKIGSQANRQNLLFCLLLAGGVAFALWKCFYGFGGDDEAFYLTIPDRLLNGDALFKDEWHLSQMSGFLRMPFLWICKLITGGEGIMLAARFTYVILHAGIAAVIYVRLRKYGYTSVFASVLFFLFTPYDIMALCYNTVGLDLVVLTGVIMGTADYSKKLPLIISGLTFAGAVLCSPYLAAAYVLYGICVIVHYIIKNKDSGFVLKSSMFSVKAFLWFTLGVAVLAGVFLIFTLTRVSVGEIFTNLPYMMSDPEHPSLALGTRITTYFTSIYNLHPCFKFGLFSYLIMLVVMIFDKKRRLHRSLYLIISAAVVMFCYALLYPELIARNYNALMFPMVFVGITSYILCSKKPNTLFVSLFVPGIIYSLALHFTSNQYFYVISMALSASSIASIIFLGQLLREMKETEDNLDYRVLLKNTSLVMVTLMLLLQGGLQIYTKANHCFWETDRASLDTKIDAGPAKGIYTSKAKQEEYNSIYSDLSYYGNKEKDNILFLTSKTWCYLAVDGFSYGTMSAWISGENETSVERLKSYYSLNPQKEPRYIYIPKSSAWNFTNIRTEAAYAGYTVDENSVSYKLERSK